MDLIDGLDPLWLALVHLKRRQYTKSAAICEELLREQPRDQAALFLRYRARSGTNEHDATELEDEGVGDLMLDDNAISSHPRPGTSTTRPSTTADSMRPGTGVSDRPTTGFARPGTASRPITGKSEVATALSSRSPGTASTSSRPITSLGRELRLGTASGALVLDKLFSGRGSLDNQKLLRNPAMARVVCDYLLRYERNPTGALELCGEALKEASEGWWWKYCQGRCYYQLGLYRDAERALSSSIQDQRMVPAVLELAKVYLRMDQPTAALEVLQSALAAMPDNIRITLWIARVQEFVHATELSIDTYKQVVRLDASHVEGLACLAASYFYAGYPEMSLRYYRRLLQMGVSGPEIWNNIGLCCFYSSQFDLALNCFGRAIQLADDHSDIWYNVGHVGIGIGDRDFAMQSFKIALSLDHAHAESLNNLGVLATRDQDAASALTCFADAQKKGSDLFQPFFNSALVTHKLGNLKDACTLVSASLKINAQHTDSIDLKKELQRVFRII